MSDAQPILNIPAEYSPVALYYEGADSLEYIRRDIPAVYRRVDHALTLIVSMDDRDEVIGFQLKGFRNLYLKIPQPTQLNFLSLVGLLERAFTDAGGQIVDGFRKEAYARAQQMAVDDKVMVRDLPKAVGASCH